MGVNSSDLQFLLRSEKVLKTPIRVCDIGAQSFDHGDDAVIQRLATAINRSIDISSLADVDSCAQLWRLLGVDYTSIDVTPDATHFMDLNFDHAPDQLVGRFTLVINSGTTEHVFNQYNAFKVIHDLTQKSGFMYHSVPMAGYTNHRLINYNMRTFHALCKANKYRLVDCDISFDAGRARISEAVLGTLSGYCSEGQIRRLRDEFVSMDAGGRILLQKMTDEPFMSPLDLPAEARISVGVSPTGRLTHGSALGGRLARAIGLLRRGRAALRLTRLG